MARMDRWERREKKLEKAKRRMPMSGAGLRTHVVNGERKRAERLRARADRRRPTS